MPEQPSPERVGDRHDNPVVEGEPTDVNVRAILWLLLVLSAGCVVVFTAMWWLREGFLAREQAANPALTPLAERESVRLPRDLNKLPSPRLHADDREELEALRAYEKERLTTYGWVDRESGVVRIPVNEAMRLVAEEGLPARAK
jgi:hypothetical protein